MTRLVIATLDRHWPLLGSAEADDGASAVDVRPGDDVQPDDGCTEIRRRTLTAVGLTTRRRLPRSSAAAGDAARVRLPRSRRRLTRRTALRRLPRPRRRPAEAGDKASATV